MAEASVWLAQVREAEQQGEERIRQAHADVADAVHVAERQARLMREDAVKAGQANWQRAMDAQVAQAKEINDRLADQEAQRCTQLQEQAADKMSALAEALVARMVEQYGHH